MVLCRLKDFPNIQLYSYWCRVKIVEVFNLLHLKILFDKESAMKTTDISYVFIIHSLHFTLRFLILCLCILLFTMLSEKGLPFSDLKDLEEKGRFFYLTDWNINFLRLLIFLYLGSLYKPLTFHNKGLL